MTEEEELQLTVDIHAGMHDGDKIKFDQVADEAVGHIAGDLIFVIKQIPDPIFTRQGDDLLTTLTISLEDSLLGFERKIVHLDGHEVIVRKGDITYCSEVYMIVGEGMPKKGAKGKKGNLLITLYIEFPQSFTEHQKQLLRTALHA